MNFVNSKPIHKPSLSLIQFKSCASEIKSDLNIPVKLDKSDDDTQKDTPLTTKAAAKP